MIIRISFISLFLLSSPTLSGYPTALKFTDNQVSLLAALSQEANCANSSIGKKATTTLDPAITAVLTNPYITTFHGVTGTHSRIYGSTISRAEFGSICYANSPFSATPQDKEVIVTFPGTQTMADVMSDLDTTNVSLYECGNKCLSKDPFPKIAKSLLSKEYEDIIEGGEDTSLVSKDVGVERGFGEVYLSTKECLMKNIDTIRNKHNITDSELRLIVTGHSLGGAVATIAAIDLWHEYFDKKPNIPDNPMTVVTFGAPAVFKGPVKRGMSMKKYFDQPTWDVTTQALWDSSIGADNILRLVDADDPVPQVLCSSYQEIAKPYYHQLGTEQTISTRTWGRLTLPSIVLQEKAKRHPIKHYRTHIDNGDFNLPVS